MLTRYELTRLLASPAFPAFDARVRRDLRRLVRQHGPRRPLVLDVGARTSPFTAGLPLRVVALDLPREDERQHDMALGLTDEITDQLHRRRSNVERVLLQDMVHCQEPTASYDGAVVVEVIEHVADDDAFVAQVRRVVRPGGWAYVTTPNGDYILNEGVDAHPDHHRHYTRTTLTALLSRHFDEVSVEWGIRTGHHRWQGQQLHKARGPLAVGRVTVANLRSRVESRGLADEPRRTANLFAICRIAP